MNTSDQSIADQPQLVDYLKQAQEVYKHGRSMPDYGQLAVLIDIAQSLRKIATVLEKNRQDQIDEIDRKEVLRHIKKCHL